MIVADSLGRRSIVGIALAAGAMLVLLALVRPIDHDESQYVAAAALTAHGLLPYRDFAYLQTPLQPFLVAPVVRAAGEWAWPALRIVNALLGATTIGFVVAGARASGAGSRVALAAGAALFACDILLFSAGVARNDALPAACLAAALWICLARGRSRSGAAAVGLLVAAAAAAKLSYVFPAAALGLYLLIHRRALAGWALAGAAPMLLFVGWTWSLAPPAFWFEVVTFPCLAPAEFYADRPWKLSAAAKLLDSTKFLALGAALPALAAVALAAWRDRRLTLLDWLVIAGLLAALTPSPTWRQYLLPVLPPLFMRLAALWDARAPSRGWRIVFTLFGIAGLAPTVTGFFPDKTPSLLEAMRERGGLRAALDANGVGRTVATLSPQFLPAVGRLPDPRFATGPFYFRSRALLSPAVERRFHLVSHRRASAVGLMDVLGPAADAGDGRQDRWDGLLLRRAVGRRVTAEGTGSVIVRARPYP